MICKKLLNTYIHNPLYSLVSYFRLVITTSIFEDNKKKQFHEYRKIPYRKPKIDNWGKIFDEKIVFIRETNKMNTLNILL